MECPFESITTHAIFMSLLNDPGPNGEIVFVNFTTRKDLCDANAEIITRADCGLLSHESVIAFWKTPHVFRKYLNL